MGEDISSPHESELYFDPTLPRSSGELEPSPVNFLQFSVSKKRNFRQRNFIKNLWA